MNVKSLLAGSLLIGALLAVGGSLGYWKYKDLHKPAPPAFMPPQAVDMIEAKTVSWRPTARLVGTVVAKRSITLANEIAGVVTEVDFQTGDTVEPGQVLLKEDTSTEKADLASAQAAERLAQASIDVAKADIRASQSDLELAVNNQKRFKDAATSVSAAELDKSDADLRKARADHDRDQAALIKSQAEQEQAAAHVQQIMTTIAKKTLTAPFHGLAGIRSVHPGQYLAEGTSIVGLMELTDDIYVDFAVPQEYAARVIPGAVVIASSEVLGTKEARITVVSVDAMVNPTTRNVRIRSSVADPQHRLKQGMAIDVEVPTELAKNYVVVPATAVRRASFGDHVFVITPGDPGPDGKPSMVAHQRMVTLGPDLGGTVIISTGLKAGEKIASGGSFKLHDGSTVFPGTPPEAAPTTEVSVK